VSAKHPVWNVEKEDLGKILCGHTVYEGDSKQMWPSYELNSLAGAGSQGQSELGGPRFSNSLRHVERLSLSLHTAKGFEPNPKGQVGPECLLDTGCIITEPIRITADQSWR
jgi:hypothetical protein